MPMPMLPAPPAKQHKSRRSVTCHLIAELHGDLPAGAVHGKQNRFRLTESGYATGSSREGNLMEFSAYFRFVAALVLCWA